MPVLWRPDKPIIVGRAGRMAPCLFSRWQNARIAAQTRQCRAVYARAWRLYSMALRRESAEKPRRARYPLGVPQHKGAMTCASAKSFRNIDEEKISIAEVTQFIRVCSWL